MKKEKFDIQGMTCSSCSAHIERAILKLNGVKNINVNLLSNNMILEYDESVLDENIIINAVVDSGYGASLASAEKEENCIEKIDNKSNIKSMKKRLIASIFFLIPLMYLAMNNMLYESIGLAIPSFITDWFDGTNNAVSFGFTQFLLLLPILYLNRNYFITGFKRLFKGVPNMDSLIALGSTAATVYGIFSLFMIGYGLGHGSLDIVERYRMDLYFESAGTILTLITLGKYLETKSKSKTSNAISKLINLSPKVSTVIRNDTEIEIKSDEIMVGDILLIKPGSSIPVDGVIVEGSSSVDQSNITGESIPIFKGVNDFVISGTINKNGFFKMKANKVGKDTTLSQIIKLVEEASNSKAPISKLADKVSAVFVPIVILISILATCFWILNGQGFGFAISIGIAVLVISCPCALGLATPVAIMVGTGKAAEKGILFKSAESLESLHLVDTVIFDKTGTITKGKPVLTNIVSKIKENELLCIAGSLEKISEHPLAEAIMEKVYERELELSSVDEFSYVPGRGISGRINGREYLIGNYLFLKENNINVDSEKADEFLKEGKSVLYVADKNELIGIIAVADVLKETSEKVIKELKKQNIEIVMLTGDNKIVANRIASTLGIEHVVAELLPQDKEKEISKLQARGKKVAFVGDGINDSIALVKADVGIAIGSGTDIAIDSADVILMKDNLIDVVTSIKISKAVIKNIKINLFWAFFYNSLVIPIAAGVFVNWGLKLNPMLGALAMSLSSVCVITNALRLKKFKVKYDENLKEENDMEIKKKEIIIDGMQCNHCKASVEKVLATVEGVTTVEVDLEKKKAIIEYCVEVSDEKIREVINEEGFYVLEIK